jgi:AAA domain/Primase C terminal 2 (PriCT-2)
VSAADDDERSPRAREYNPLERFADCKIWVFWQGKLDEQGNVDKGGPRDVRDGSPGRTNDSNTWGTLGQAKAALRSAKASGQWDKRAGGGGGIILGQHVSENQILVGIDLDACRDPKTEQLTPWVQEIIEKFPTYAEVSPSETGVKLFLLVNDSEIKILDELFEGRAKRKFVQGKGKHPPAVEVVRNGYFTVTGNGIAEFPVNEFSVDRDLRWLLQEAGPQFAPTEKSNGSEHRRNKKGHEKPSREKIMSALAAIDNNEVGVAYDDWRDVGFALHDVDEFELWRDWSALSDKHREEKCVADWSGFKKLERGITVATLFHKASLTGWRWQENGRRSGAGVGQEGVRQKSVVELIRGSDIEPEPISWLWEDWLARGKMHLICGKPSGGKTTIALSLAAIVSRAASRPMPWPDGTQCTIGGKVVIWSGEDDRADTLVPRLLAAGADLHQIHFVGNVREDGQRRPFDPASDMPLLQEAIKKAGDVALLIVDPIVSAVAGDSHKNAETRRGLQPLADLAQEAGAALIGVTHFSKGTAGKDPIERVTGSLAFGAVARIVLVAAKPEAGAPDGNASRVFLRAKSNIGPEGGGYAYELPVISLPGSGIRAMRVTWGAPLTGTARALLEEAEQSRSAAQDAWDFLKGILGDGPIPVSKIMAEAKASGLSWRTIQRVKTARHIHSWKLNDANSGWVWSLTPKPI